MSTDAEPIAAVEHLSITDIKRWCWKAANDDLIEVSQEIQRIAKHRQKGYDD